MIGTIYRDTVLKQQMRLFRGAMGADFFMGDNAHPHCATIVNECLEEEDITRLERAALSPDSNPIEHAWDILD